MAVSSDRVPARASVPALLLVLGGVATAVASLWSDWAVGAYEWSRSFTENGWQWMAYGDVLLVLACALLVFAVGSILLRPKFHAVGLGIGAMLLIVCAICGALVVTALTFNPGAGPTVAIIGLLVAGLGVVIAMLGAAPHNPPRLADWHLPHPFQHTH